MFSLRDVALTRRGGIPLALPRSSSSGRRTTSAQGQGDLRITVRASPSSTSLRASHSSSTSHRLGFPDEYAGASDRACKFSSALTAKAYGAAGQAASALHAMALLQVHQAKALKQLHEGDADQGVLQELCTATGLALRATKVRLVESPRMVLGRDAEVLTGLPPAVVNTITSARALSTRQAYRLKWNLFINWCSPRREDPRRCPIAVVLSFMQDGLERRLSPSTLKVYVAAIAAHHVAVDGKSLGKHDLVIRFLRGARRLNPPRPHLVPSWDLPLVLSALRGAPFEPLQSVELKFLSLKTVLLSALATVKRVGDLQAFSVDDSYLEFGPADSHVVLRPRPVYVPKVPTMPFRDQVVNLQALPREEADQAIALLCPVPCLADLCGPHAELQDLRPALCLLRRTAEGKSCLQTKTRPLDSGGYSLGLSGPALTVPPWCESTLYERCCFLLGFGARRLNSRHL